MSPINTGRIGHCCESAFEEKVGKSGSANGGSLSILAGVASMITSSLELLHDSATLALLAVFASIFWALYKGLAGPLSSIPGPWHTKFTGLVLRYKVLTGQRVFYIHNLHQKYGPLVRIDPHEVNVCDLDAFSEVHRIGSGFTKAAWYDRATYGIEGNVFVMTNVREHAARRRLLARPFSRSSLVVNFQSLVTDRSRLAVANIKREANLGDCDVMKWWTLMATDVVAQVAFGEDSHLLEAGEKTSYINDLENVVQAWALRGEEPALYHTLRFVAPKLMRGFDISLKNVVEYGTSAATRAKDKEIKRENIISGMISASQEEGTKMTNSALGAQASALIVAGSHTTAATLTYAVWAIICHPDVRSKLEEEVLSIPENYNDTLLEKLPYLKAVIMESLRLYGAAPGSLPRTTPENGIQIKGHLISAGVTVTTQAYTMHRDPAIFPDPEKFDPERFYQKDMTAQQKSAFGPFGGGTRVCLGIHLAEMELRHGLAEFFRECREITLSELTTPESMEMENYFLISPKSKRCFVKNAKLAVVNG